MCGICIGTFVILTCMCLCACGGWRLKLCVSLICFFNLWGRVFHLIADLPDLAHLGSHFPPGIPFSTSHVLQLQEGHLAYWHICAGGSKVWSSCVCVYVLYSLSHVLIVCECMCPGTMPVHTCKPEERVKGPNLSLSDLLSWETFLLRLELVWPPAMAMSSWLCHP